MLECDDDIRIIEVDDTDERDGIEVGMLGFVVEDMNHITIWIEDIQDRRKMYAYQLEKYRWRN